MSILLDFLFCFPLNHDPGRKWSLWLSLWDVCIRLQGQQHIKVLPGCCSILEPWKATRLVFLHASASYECYLGASVSFLVRPLIARIPSCAFSRCDSAGINPFRTEAERIDSGFHLQTALLNEPVRARLTSPNHSCIFFLPSSSAPLSLVCIH